VNFFTEPGATQWLVPTDFVVPGTAPGTTATFYLRVSAPGWENFNFVSKDFTSNLGGTLPSGASLPPGDTSGLAFVMPLFPEPSTVVFGTVGGLALLLFRRRR
jgi:hypothetical protein